MFFLLVCLLSLSLGDVLNTQANSAGGEVPGALPSTAITGNLSSPMKHDLSLLGLVLAPQEKPLKVFLTGYGDFQHYNRAEGRINPSASLAETVAKMGVRNAFIQWRELPVTMEGVDKYVEELKALPEEDQPDVALSLGVSSKAQLEEAPENWIGRSRTSRDGSGNVLPHDRIDPRVRANKRIRSDLPLDEIEEAMDQMFGDDRKMHSSDRNKRDYKPDQSAYLCNYLNWKLTKLYGKNKRVIAGFVHIIPTLPPQEVQTVVQAVVNKQILTDRKLDKARCSRTGGQCLKKGTLTETCAGTAHNGFKDCGRRNRCCYASQERKYFDTGLD